MAVVGKPEHNGRNISNSRNGGDGQCASKIPGSDWKRHIIWRHIDPRYWLSVPIKNPILHHPGAGVPMIALTTRIRADAPWSECDGTALIQGSAAVFASTKSTNCGWGRRSYEPSLSSMRVMRYP